jgi:hypothetical protein
MSPVAGLLETGGRSTLPRCAPRSRPPRHAPARPRSRPRPSRSPSQPQRGRRTPALPPRSTSPRSSLRLRPAPTPLPQGGRRVGALWVRNEEGRGQTGPAARRAVHTNSGIPSPGPLLNQQLGRGRRRRRRAARTGARRAPPPQAAGGCLTRGRGRRRAAGAQEGLGQGVPAAARREQRRMLLGPAKGTCPFFLFLSAGGHRRRLAGGRRRRRHQGRQCCRRAVQRGLGQGGRAQPRRRLWGGGGQAGVLHWHAHPLPACPRILTPALLPPPQVAKDKGIPYFLAA